MKNKLTIYLLLSLISIFLITFGFTFDLIGSIFSLAESIQLLNENSVQGLESILATSILEILACVACIVIVSLESKKIKKGTYDNGRLIYEVTTIFYTLLAIVLILVLTAFGVIDAGILTLAILLLFVAAYNAFLIYFKKKLKASLAKILSIVADILDFIFIIILLVTYLNASAMGILVGAFLIVIYIINSTIDIISLFNKSLLDKVITNINTQEEKPLEAKEEQKEDKTE